MNRCEEPVYLLFLFRYETATHHLSTNLFELVNVCAHICTTDVLHHFNALFQGMQLLLGEAVVSDEELFVGTVAVEFSRLLDVSDSFSFLT